MILSKKVISLFLFSATLLLFPILAEGTWGQSSTSDNEILAVVTPPFDPESQLCQWSNQDKSDPGAVIPDGALLGQPNPVFCSIVNTGVGTAKPNFFGPNSWFDDFDHGLSFATFDDTNYRVFENVDDGFNASIHWRHANHWMTDVHRDSDHPRGGATISPNQSFKFEDGKLVIESIFAAGHQDYDNLEAWGEITISTAPEPTGFIGSGSIYSYAMFKGHWTFGCRLHSNRKPKCALMDDTGRTATRVGGVGRAWEMSFFQWVGTDRFGGNPNVDIPGTDTKLGEYYRSCDENTDPDTLCRDKFRLEIAQNSVKLYVNGQLYWEQSGEFYTDGASVSEEHFDVLRDPDTGEIQFFPEEWIESPELYVYFSSMSSQRNATNELFRYHWDDIAINPTTPPNADNVPNFADPITNKPTSTPVNEPPETMVPPETSVPNSTPTPTPTPTSPGTTILPNTPTSTPIPTPDPETAALWMMPTNVTATRGDTFDIDVLALIGIQKANAASAYITFDPNLVKIVSVLPGDQLDLVAQNDIDNAKGLFSFAAASSSGEVSGSVRLAKITFEALEDSKSLLSFSLTAQTKSDIALNGISILDKVQNAEVLIAGNDTQMLVGQVQLEGRPIPPHPSWVTQLQVALAQSSSITPTYTFNPTTTEDGMFIVENIKAGSYVVSVKGPHTLDRIVNATLETGRTNVDIGPLQEGDAVDDNVVNVLDFSLLAGSMGLCLGNDGFAQNADFNDDNCIDLLDLSLLSNNFGQVGDSFIKRAQNVNQRELPVSLMTLESRRAKERIALGINVEGPAYTLVDASEISINFDKELLKVVSVGGGALDVELHNEINNELGEISYAAGTLDYQVELPIRLATVVLEVTQDFDSSQLTVELAGERGAKFVYQGKSIPFATNGTDGVSLSVVELKLDRRQLLPFTVQ